MRAAPVVLLSAALAFGGGARAENWVHTRDNGGGLPMCFDKDSVRVDADKLTHYAIKMCQDTGAVQYAVDCTQNFRVEVVVRVYDRRDPTHYNEIVVDDPQSGTAVDAAMACGK